MANLHKNPLLMKCHDLIQAIEVCGASPELTHAVTTAGELMESIDKMIDAIALAYGFLWHVNDEPYAPIRTYSKERAAYEARRALRDTLTNEHRGQAITRARELIDAQRETPTAPIEGPLKVREIAPGMVGGEQNADVFIDPQGRFWRADTTITLGACPTCGGQAQYIGGPGQPLSMQHVDPRATDGTEAPLEGQTEIDVIRPEVLAFAKVMEQKLRENEHKGGWRNDSTWALLARLREEVGEMYDVLSSPIDPVVVGREAADVANFAMMIADNAGALSKARPATPAGLTTESPVPADHPVMKAWEAFKEIDAYANARKWALHERHVDGSLFAMFMAGWERSSWVYPQILDRQEGK